MTLKINALEKISTDFSREIYREKDVTELNDFNKELLSNKSNELHIKS